MSLQLATYYQRIRLWKPTGVGKHILNMSEAISRLNGPLQSFHAVDDLKDAERRGVDLPFETPAPLSIPIPRKFLEASWVSFRFPAPSMFGVEADWIYCPAEYFVPSGRHANLAVTIHCDNWFNPELPWYNDPDIAETRKRRWPLYKAITQRADKILCVSHFLKQRVVDFFKVDPARISVVGNGVEPVFFAPRSNAPHVSQHLHDSPYVVVLGGLTRRKGAQATLQVARELNRAAPDIKVTVVGTSEQVFLQEAHALPNVVSLGYVGVGEGLPSLLANAVALLFLSEYETFGIPAVEAMASGTPPIVSSKGALPEVVGSAGYVLKPGNELEAVEAIIALNKNASYRDAQGAAAVERAKRFSWEWSFSQLREALS